MLITCPGADDLARFGADIGEGSCAPGIAEHIECCADCQEFLRRRVEDGLESLMKQPTGFQPPGTVPKVAGFTIERELGRGAMGVVYLARRDTPRRRVALKLMSGGRRAEPRERRQWLREAEAASSLRHTNVVTLYEVVEADDCFLLVLEYIPGGTLADRLSGPVAPRDAARVMETIARAVHHIHLCGLLHLDLKPSNILLDGVADGAWEAVIPKVSDFGIARSADASGTDTTGFAAGGTPPYIAPEQITLPRKDLTPRADIHALGAMLYHMLTGVPPYRGLTALNMLEQIRNQEPVPPRRLIAQVPHDLETITLKCLQKHPSARYSSTEAMADDLHHWLDGRPISARPVSPIEKSWRWCRRRPVIAALATALALTLSFGFLAVVLLWTRAESARQSAVAELNFAEMLLNEFCGLTPAVLTGLPGWNRDEIITILDKARINILRHRAERADDLLPIRQLARVDFCLASHLVFQKQWYRARYLLGECLESVDYVLQQNPLDGMSIWQRVQAFKALASVADQEGKSEESLRHLETAVTYGWKCVRQKGSSDLIDYALFIDELAETAWTLAQAFQSSGNHEKAQALMFETGRMLNEVPEEKMDSTIAVWIVLVGLDRHLLRTEFTIASARRQDQPNPISQRATSEAERLDAASWATSVARSLSSRDGAHALSDIKVDKLTLHFVNRITWQRRSRRIDEAQWLAERMHALARLIVARNPAKPAAHFMLCAALTQLAKQGWETNDLLSVERNWTLAIQSAREVVRLDPQNARAFHEMNDLQNRLDKLKAEMASASQDAGPRS
jgi:serine/threonine protein kinase